MTVGMPPMSGPAEGLSLDEVLLRKMLLREVLLREDWLDELSRAMRPGTCDPQSDREPSGGQETELLNELLGDYIFHLARLLSEITKSL